MKHFAELYFPKNEFRIKNDLDSFFHYHGIRRLFLDYSRQSVILKNVNKIQLLSVDRKDATNTSTLWMANGFAITTSQSLIPTEMVMSTTMLR